MYLTQWDKLFWLAGFLGHLVLLCVLLYKRQWREFPVFVLLIVFESLKTVILSLVSMHGSRVAYARAYWIFAFGDYLFQIAVIIEVARHVLRPSEKWVEGARAAFIKWSCVGSATAFALSIGIHSSSTSSVVTWETRAGLFTSILTCELFLAMSYVAFHLRMLWRSPVMAIGEGLAGWAIVAFTGDLAYILAGSSRALVVTDRIRMSIYLCTLLLWIKAFLFPKREAIPTSAEIEACLVALSNRLEHTI